MKPNPTLPMSNSHAAPQRGWRYWLVALVVLLVYAWVGTALFDWVLTHPRDLGWLLVLGLFLYVGTAAWVGFNATRPSRLPLFITAPEELGFTYEEIVFTSRDGIPLSGWYVPGHNGAAVVLTHGFRENRLGSVPIARMLVKAGYGVLLYDLRGHGRSRGNLCTWGWTETNDLRAAVDYLCGRAEVDPQRVGAYGFSLGGQIALRTAAQDKRIRAVLSDGANPAVLQDHTYANRIQMSRHWLWNFIGYGFQALLTGLRPPLGVADSIGQIAPRPVLLIATGRGHERNNNREYFRRAGEPRELWEIPEAKHGEGPYRCADEYEEKLLTFFGHYL